MVSVGSVGVAGDQGQLWVGHGEMTKAGPSYRQVDHWTRTGYLRAAGLGTGHVRRWPLTERDIGAMMHRLVDVGLPPKVAHDVARAGGDCIIGPGVRIVVTVDDAAP